MLLDLNLTSVFDKFSTLFMSLHANTRLADNRAKTFCVFVCVLVYNVCICFIMSFPSGW